MKNHLIIFKERIDDLKGKVDEFNLCFQTLSKTERAFFNYFLFIMINPRKPFQKFIFKS